MKRILLAMLPLLAASYSYAQNTFPWPTTGNIGIGTTSPANTLDVNGGINTNNTSTINGVTYSTVYTNVRQLQALGYNFSVASGDNNSSLLIPYNNSTYPHFQNFGLLVDGNLGIGVSVPAQKISADGNISIQSSGTNAKGFLFSSPSSNWGPQFSGMYFTPRDGVNATTDFQVSLWDGIRGVHNRLFINGYNGYVGIGTTQPDQALTVIGTVHATEVLVEQIVATPDYVFDKDYNLASLKEVKTYIDKNHHLPEIPSAAKVAKDGINLGEMNAKLLKKIEELTLYLIQQKEDSDTQNISQQQQIDKLTRQVKSLQNANKKSSSTDH